MHYCLLIALADNIFFRMRLGDYHIGHHHISSPRTTLWSVLWRKPFSQLLPSPLPQFSHPLPALYYTHAASTLYGPSLIQGRVLDLKRILYVSSGPLTITYPSYILSHQWSRSVSQAPFSGCWSRSLNSLNL